MKIGRMLMQSPDPLDSEMGRDQDTNSPRIFWNTHYHRHLHRFEMHHYVYLPQCYILKIQKIRKIHQNRHHHHHEKFVVDLRTFFTRYRGKRLNSLSL